MSHLSFSGTHLFLDQNLLSLSQFHIIARNRCQLGSLHSDHRLTITSCGTTSHRDGEFFFIKVDNLCYWLFRCDLSRNTRKTSMEQSEGSLIGPKLKGLKISSNVQRANCDNPIFLIQMLATAFERGVQLGRPNKCLYYDFFSHII